MMLNWPEVAEKAVRRYYNIHPIRRIHSRVLDLQDVVNEEVVVVNCEVGCGLQMTTTHQFVTYAKYVVICFPDSP